MTEEYLDWRLGIFGNPFVFQHFIFGVKKYFKKRKKRGYRNRYNLIHRPSGCNNYNKELFKPYSKHMKVFYAHNQ